MKQKFTGLKELILESGVPVSGFDRCGTKETVITEYGKRKNAEKLSEDNQMETFVEYGDIEALTEVTKKLLENGNEKTQLSNIAKKCYSKEQMSNAYLNLYQEIM